MAPENPTVGRLDSILRYAVPSLFLGFSLAVLLAPGSSRRVEAQSASQVGTGLIALTDDAPGNPNATLLYLIDPREQSLAVYRVDGLKGTIKLDAARHFRADLKVSEYNNISPNVAAVEAMVAPARVGSEPRNP